MIFTTRPQRQYKDRLFKAVFGRNTEESKRWRLDLYNALNGTNYTDPDALKLNTIEDVIYVTMYNDVSFLIDDQIVLYEQQSSHNQNMPLRGFLYFAQLYYKFLEENKKDPNRTGLIRIPAPKFVVLYNGPAEMPDDFEMRLSDAFITPDKSGAYEWVAYVKNINAKHNQGLQKKCKPLYDYSRFVENVRENKRNGMDDKKAVDSAVNDAIKNNLLDGFFGRRKSEVIKMILTEFNEELFRQNVREDGYLEGREDGLSEGLRRKALEDAENFLKADITPEIIANCTGLPLEDVLRIAESLSVKT